MIKRIGSWTLQKSDINPKAIKKARKVIWKAFKKDPDFKRGYIDNVAMCIFANSPVKEYKARNNLAEKIIDLVFGE